MSRLFNQSILISTDAYKFSHPFMVESNVTKLTSYIEARNGSPITFFGLQAFIKEYLQHPFSMDDINEAEEFAQSAYIPFHREMWEYFLDKYDGYLPIKIQALKEGTTLSSGNVVVQISSTDEKYPQIISVVETPLLRSIWYPSEVATISRNIKVLIKRYLEKTSDADPKELMAVRLNDFGARGASSQETAGIGGLAHLINFLGSDTVEAIKPAIHYYNHNLKTDGPVLISVPATEHSVTTINGPEGEADFVSRTLKKFEKSPFVSIVGDSYDFDNFVTNIIGKQLKPQIDNGTSTAVVRPDSGIPEEIVPHTAEMIDASYGSTINSKGYKVLNPKVRIIQGDGININSIEKILDALIARGYSAENVIFGMGGMLLQAPMRDDHSWAMKTNEAVINGTVHFVQKKPKTDLKKSSKAGRQAVVKVNGEFMTIPEANLPTPDTASHGVVNYLEDVWDTGHFIRTQTLNEIRKVADV